MKVLVANIPLRRNRFLRDLNAALGKQVDLLHSSDEFWAMRGEYDVVHLHWPEYITYGIEAAYNSTLDEELISAVTARLQFWSSRSALIVTRHNPFPYNAPGNPEWARLFRAVYEHAAGVVHLGKASIEAFSEQYADLVIRGHRPVKHTVIPIHNYTSLPNELDRRSGRKHLGIPASAEVILVFGAIRSDSERKLILDAFRLVNAPRKVLLASTWREANPVLANRSLTNLVRRTTRLYHRLHPQYKFNYGFVEESDAQLFVNSADVLFIPRIQVLNSANVSLGMTFGRVVVGPDLGNVGELLRDTGNPVFDPTNPVSAARAMEHGLRLAEAGGLGEANRRIALTEWDVDRCAERYVEFFREVAGRTVIPH